MNLSLTVGVEIELIHTSTLIMTKVAYFSVWNSSRMLLQGGSAETIRWQVQVISAVSLSVWHIHCLLIQDKLTAEWFMMSAIVRWHSSCLKTTILGCEYTTLVRCHKCSWITASLTIICHFCCSKKHLLLKTHLRIQIATIPRCCRSREKWLLLSVTDKNSLKEMSFQGALPWIKAVCEINNHFLCLDKSRKNRERVSGLASEKSPVPWALHLSHTIQHIPPSGEEGLLETTLH